LVCLDARLPHVDRVSRSAPARGDFHTPIELRRDALKVYFTMGNGVEVESVVSLLGNNADFCGVPQIRSLATLFTATNAARDLPLT